MKYLLLPLMLLFFAPLSAQSDGTPQKEFLPLPVETLRLDFDLFRQGMEKYHTGLYWYTTKAKFDAAFDQALAKIDHPMDVFEFHRLLAPLVALSREDHCNIHLPEEAHAYFLEQPLFPFSVQFLDQKMYLILNGSKIDEDLSRHQVESINGVKVEGLVQQLGNLFASDGYAKAVKYSDLNGMGFAQYYYYQFGAVGEFKIDFYPDGKGSPGISRTVEAQTLKQFRKTHAARKPAAKPPEKQETLEFKILSDNVAYLGIHTFSTSQYKDNKVHRKYRKFLKTTFKAIDDKGIEHLIIDVSQNGGGNEGNENRLFSYLGENYQKYHSVNAKVGKIRLDNGVDPAIKAKTFGFFEGKLLNKRQADGSYARRPNIGYGLMAYKKEPKTKYGGNVYVMISPVTYSGGSEFASMVYTRKRGKFYGEETGGGYQGNTSGYSFELELPHSGIEVIVPALKFHMNVAGLPAGSPVVPHQKVIPTIDQFLAGEDVVVNAILEEIERGR